MCIKLTYFIACRQCKFSTPCSMKWFVVLFFTLLFFGERTFAGKCDANDAINVFELVHEEFDKAFNSIPTLSIEIGDKYAAEKFSVRYKKSVANYAESLIVNLYDQAVHAGERLIYDLRKYCKQLERSIESMHRRHSEPFCLDEDLKLITKQLRLFLRLNPGNVEIECPNFSDLPPDELEANAPANHTASDLFLRYSAVTRNLARGMYRYLTSVYLAAWHNMRQCYDTIVREFRNKILNDSVLDAYTRDVRRIFAKHRLIRKNVRKETWEAFEEAGHRIIAISDECNA